MIGRIFLRALGAIIGPDFGGHTLNEAMLKHPLPMRCPTCNVRKTVEVGDIFGKRATGRATICTCGDQMIYNPVGQTDEEFRERVRVTKERQAGVAERRSDRAS